jgi:hypothetical protein
VRKRASWAAILLGDAGSLVQVFVMENVWGMVCDMREGSVYHDSYGCSWVTGMFFLGYFFFALNNVVFMFFVGFSAFFVFYLR